jgi:hypothetical protein
MATLNVMNAGSSSALVQRAEELPNLLPMDEKALQPHFTFHPMLIVPYS